MIENWQVIIHEGVSEQKAEIARAFWQFTAVKCSVAFEYTTKELSQRFEMSAHELRQVQIQSCSIQAPEYECKRCQSVIQWKALTISTRGEFIDDIFRQSSINICDDCRAKHRAQEQLRLEEHKRMRAQEQAAKKERTRQRYGERIVGDCPRCDGLLIIRKSRTGGVFVGCTEYPDCEHTAQIPKPISDPDVQEIAEARKLLEDAPKCLLCNAPLRQIKGKFGMFLGCTAYPQCRYTVNLADPAQPAAPSMPPPREDMAAVKEHELAKIDREMEEFDTDSLIC